jgi:hypothetical protein
MKRRLFVGGALAGLSITGTFAKPQKVKVGDIPKGLSHEKQISTRRSLGANAANICLWAKAQSLCQCISHRDGDSR